MSNETFRVGEIAIVVGSMRPAWNGKEVEILSGLIYHPKGPRYRISDPDGEMGFVCYATPAHLRKRRPPQDPAYVKFRDQFVREFAMDDWRRAGAGIAHALKGGRNV